MSLWQPSMYRLSPAGPKETVLFLHGFMGNKDDWQEIIERLGPDYRTLALDLPGHGALGKLVDERAYPIAQCARDVVNLLDELKIETCHLVGYSMGGRLGLYLITYFAGRFEDAVLESTSPGLVGEEERAARRRHDEQLADVLRQIGMKLFVANWYRQPLFHHMPPGDRLHALLARRERNTPEGLARSLRLMGTGAQPSLWDRLDNCTRPILFMAGVLDEKYSRLAAEMEQRCPNGKAVLVENAGHNVHFEQPDSYAELLRLFLAQNRENEHVDDNLV